jgi:hypothetical protein
MMLSRRKDKSHNAYNLAGDGLKIYKDPMKNYGHR